MSQYYYNINNTQQGPIAKDELLNLYRKGEIVNETPIWTVGYSDWQQLVNTELFEEFKKFALPPPINNLPPPLKLSVIETKKSEFLEGDNYIVEYGSERAEEATSYYVYNKLQEEIGTVQKLKTKKIWMFYDRHQQAFSYEIRDIKNQVLAIISREKSLMLTDKIVIQNGLGQEIGYVQPDYKPLKFLSIYKIFDQTESQIAEVVVDWKAWDFVLHNPSNISIGTINKISTGLKDFFLTNSEKYAIKIDSEKISNENKLLLISSSIIIYIVSRLNTRA